MRTAMLLILLFGCEHRPLATGTQVNALGDTTPVRHRDIVFVLHAGRSMGFDCFADAVPAPSEWICNAEPQAGWDAQLAGLSRAIEQIPPNGSVRATVLVNTLGQQSFSNDREVLAGPLTAVSSIRPLHRIVIESASERDSLAAEILEIPLPLVRHMPPARNQCRTGWPRNDGACTPGARGAWGLHAAANSLAAVDDWEQSTKEVCLATTRQDAFLLPNGGTNILVFEPTFPAQAFSAEAAWASAMGTVDRFSVVALEEQDDPVRLPDESAVVRVFGAVESDTIVEASVRGVAGFPRAAFELRASTLLTEGMTSDDAAARIAAALHAADLESPVLPALSVASGPSAIGISYRRLPELSPLFVTVSPVAGLRMEVSTNANTWASAARAWGPAIRSTRGHLRLIDSPNEWESAFASCIREDVHFVGMEVTQSIQSWRQRVPLVEGKRTLVRVHLEASEFAPTDMTRLPEVDIRVRACRAPAEGSPCPEPDGVTSVDLTARPRSIAGGRGRPVNLRVTEETRGTRADGLVFSLPRHLTVGQLQLEVRDLNSSLRCAEPQESTAPSLRPNVSTPPADCHVRVVFRDPLREAAPGSEIRISPVRVLVRDRETGTEYAATTADLQGEFLKDHLPLAFEDVFDPDGDLVVTRSGRIRQFLLDVEYNDDVPAEPNVGFFASILETMEATRRVRNCTATACPVGAVIGVLGDLPRVPGGLAGLGGRGVAVALTDPSTQLHELLHTFGRDHTPYCMRREDFACRGAGNPDSYPYEYDLVRHRDPSDWPNAGLRPALGPSLTEAREDQVWGLTLAVNDPREGRLDLGGVLSPRSTWDVMSYCDDVLEGGSELSVTSLYQIERLIFPHTIPDGLGGVVEAGRTFAHFLEDPTTDETVPPCPTATASSPSGPLREGLLVIGSEIEGDAAIGRADLATLPVVEVDPASTSLELRSVDDTGATLFSTGAPTWEVDAIGREELPPVRQFAALVPIVPETRGILLLRNGVVVDSRTASASIPTITITAPPPSVVSSDLLLGWETEDGDGDDLTVNVELSLDGGITFTPLGYDIRASNFRYRFTTIPASEAAIVRAIVSDGFWTASATHGPFEIEDKPPEILILSPENGAIAEGALQLYALAVDAEEEGALPSGLVQWWSDLDGPLAEDGVAEFSTRDLSAGIHTLIARATDSAGLIGEASVTVEVRHSPTVGPDVSITMFGVEELVAGEPERLTVVVRNDGNRPATSLTMQYEAPNDVLVLEAAGSDWTCALSDAHADCSYVGPELLSSSDTVLSLLVQGQGSEPRELRAVHRAQSLLEGDLNPADNVTEHLVDVTGLRTEVLSQSFVAGTIAEHTVATSNVGSVTEPGPIEVEHAWAVGLTPETVEAAPPWSCELVGQSLRCMWPDALPPGSSLPVVTVAVRARASLAQSDVRFEETGPLVSPGSGERATYTTVGFNRGSVTHTAPIPYTRVLPPEVSVESVDADGWDCAVLGQSTTCIRIAPLAPGESTPPINIVGLGQSRSSLVTIIEPPDPVVPGTEQVVIVRVRNEGAGVHRENVTLDVVFEPGQDVRSAAGEGWSCRVEDLHVYCSYLAGFLEPGNELPPVLIPVVLEPGDPTDVELVVDSTAPVRDGDLLRYSITMTNNGPGDARGPFAIDEELIGAFASASGDGWACMAASGQLQCTNPTARLPATSSLPPIHVAVLAEAPPLPPAPDGVRVVRYLITNFVSFFPEFFGTAAFDVVPIGATGTTGPFEISGVQSNYRIANVTGDGWGCTTETTGVVQELTCRHSGDGLLPGQLPPRITVGINLYDDLREDDVLTDGVDVEVTGGDPCFFDLVAFRQSIVEGHLDTRIADCSERFQIFRSDWLGDGDTVFAIPPAPNHFLIEWDAPHQGGKWQYTVGVRNVGTLDTNESVEVVFDLPPGVSWSPRIGRTSSPSFNEPWSCDQVGRQVRCARDGLARKERVTLRLLFDVALDAAALQPVTVSVNNSDDVRPENNTFADRLDTVVQRFGPSFAERFDANPVETELSVDLSTASAWTADDLETASFTVVNTGTGPINDVVRVHGLGAPAVVETESVAGDGWTCETAWGSFVCTTVATDFASGAALPPLTAMFVPAPDPSGDAALTARVWRPGATTARFSSQGVDVTPSTRPDLGLIALSACPPFDDCWPIYDPSTSAEPNHLARIHLLESATSRLREARFSHGRRNDIDESTDLMAYWDSSGSSFLTNGFRVPLDRVLVDADPFSALRVAATGALDPTGNIVVGTLNDTISITRLSPPSTTVVLDPGDPFRLQEAERQVYEPVWSPDGSRIVFRQGIPPKLWITDVSVDPRGFQIGADASEPRRLTLDATARGEYNPAFSPDGSAVAFSTDSGIVVADASAGSERVVTTNAGSDVDSHPTWAPDGLSIAFQRGEANDEPLEFHASTGVLARVRTHRTRVRGRFPEFRDSGVYIVPSTGGTPMLVARGRHPAWRPAVDSLSEAAPELVPAPVVSGEVDLRVQFPAPDASVSVGPLQLRGSATAARPITSSVRAAFVIDQHSGRGVNRRFDGEYDRALATSNRFGARGLPVEWRSALPTCTSLPAGSNLIDCFAHELEQDLERANAEVAVVLSADVLPFGATNVTQAAVDTDGDGISDLLEAVAAIRYGSCGIAGTPTCVGDVEGDIRDTFDGALFATASLFDTLDPDVGTAAYLFSAGRDGVSISDDSALASLVATGTPVHVFARATQARRDDIVWVIDEGIDAFATSLDETLQDFVARLPGGDVHVALVAPTDLLGGGIGGSYAFVPATWPESVSVTDRLQAYAGDLGLRASARTHVVIVSPDGRLEGRNRMEALARTFPSGAIVHVIAPEGSPGRPVARVCETAPYPNGAGNRFYEIADLTGGTKVSICADDWTGITDAIVSDLARPAVNDCDDPTSPLSRIAAATGGQCVVVDGSQPRALMPWASDPRGAQLDRIELVHNGAAAVSFELDQTGLWDVPVEIVPGPNSLELTLFAQDGRSTTRALDVFGNTPPTALDDAFTAIPFLGTFDVLANDDDADSDDLTLVSNTPASVGSVSCSSDGLCTFAYVPGTTERVSMFTYTIADARGGMSTAKVTLDLPLPPIAADISITTPSGGGSVSFDLLASVVDPDGGEVRPEPLDQITPTGLLSCNVVGACTYTTSSTAPHEFPYRVVDDSGLAATARVIVTPGSAADFDAEVTAADFFVGEEGTYSVVLTNNGTASGDFARVAFSLDPRLSLASAVGSGWSCPLPFECQLSGVVPSGGSSSALEIRVLPTLDAIPSARSAFRVDGALTVLETPVRSRGVDFRGEFLRAVTLRDDFSTTVDVRVDNVGDVDASAPVAFTMPLPTDVIFTDPGFGSFSCVESARIVTCTSSVPIAAGGSASGLFFLQAGPLTPTSFALAGTIESAEDIAPGNDEFSVLGSRFDPSSVLEIVPGLVAVDVPSSYLFRLSDAASRDFLFVEHTLPSEVDFISVREGTGWSCREDVPRTFSCDYFPPLGFTGRGELELFVTPNASAVGGFDVEASVSSSTFTETLFFVETIQLSADIDAAAGITANQLEVGEATYLLAARNTGLLPTDTPLTLTHTVPAPLSFVGTSSVAWTCSAVGPDVSCTHVGSVASGATSEPVEISVVVPSAAKPVVPLDLSVSLAGDLRTENDSAHVDVPVVDGTGIDISLQVDADPMLRNLESGYRFIVRQERDAPVTSTITFTHSPPIGVEVVDIAGIGWTCFNVGTVFCDFSGPLGAGDAAPPVEIRARANEFASSSVELSGVVRTDDDTNSTNDEARVTVPVLDGPDARVAIATSPLSVGATGRYRIAVSNVGAATTTGVTSVNHAVPSTFALDSVGGPGWSCGLVGNDVECTTLSTIVPSGVLPEITVEVTPLPGSRPATPLVASVATDGDANPANDVGTAIVSVDSLADLALAVETVPMVAGASGSYTFRVTNEGTGATMAPHTIAHEVPGDFVLIDAVGPYACTSTGLGLTCTSSAPLEPGDASLLSILVRPNVAGTFPASGTVSLAGEANLSNNDASSLIEVSGGVDAAIHVVAPASFNLGTADSYVLEVTNAGSRARNLQVQHELPIGLNLIAVTSAAWSCVAIDRTVTCELATLETSIPTTIRIDVDVVALVPTLTLTAAVSAGGDVDLSNNTASASVDVLAALDVGAIVSAPGAARVGTPYRYSLSVTNGGTSAIGGRVQLTHTVPDVLEVFAVTGGTWLCSSANRTLTCTHPGPLGVGASLPAVTVDVNPLEAAFPSVVIAAQATLLDETDGNTTNDVAFASTTIDSAPDFSISIDAAEAGTVGALLQYALLPLGNGSTAGEVVAVTHPIPASFVLTDIEAVGWTCTVDTQLRCETVAAGELRPIVVSGRPTAPFALPIEARVSNANDADPANNQASVVVPIAGGPDVSAEIIADGFIGTRSVSYILRIENLGDATTLSPTEISHRTTPEVVVTNVTAPSDVSCTTGLPLVCRVATGLLPGATREVLVEATIPATDAITLEAIVATVADTNASNDSATVTVDVQSPLDVELRIAAPVEGEPGVEVQYSFEARNRGEEAGGAITLTHPIPMNGTFIDAIGAGWSCSVDASNLVCTRAAVASLETLPPLDVTLVPTGGDLTVAGVVAVLGDANAMNDSAETTISVESTGVLDCSSAVASETELWPPNHKLVSIEVDGLAGVTATIVSVFQDEPVDGLGDGSTSPDAVLQSDGSAKVRRERAGGGDGRVYHLGFTATDGERSCAGEVTVCVPHSRHSGCVDGGALYDSLDSDG